MSTRTIFFAGFGLIALACSIVTEHRERRAFSAPLAVNVGNDADGDGDPILTGASIARSPGGARIYVADEPNQRIYVASTASTTAGSDALPTVRVKLPGRPAQLVAFAQHVLVTIRQPGMLISFRVDSAAGLIEEHRIALADDAWGLAVTEDLQTAVVTSAWTHVVSGVDLATHTVRWSADVGREPRGVALRPEGKIAYVSHLTSRTITAIEQIDSEKPVVHAIDLPAAPLVAHADGAMEASLGYALVLSSDATRLFAPRHALGEGGGWQGALSVDGLRTPLDAPLVPPLTHELVGQAPEPGEDELVRVEAQGPALAALAAGSGVPRAAVLRRGTKTLLIADEGSGELVELDARGLAPALHPLHHYVLEGCAEADGIVLARDEATAFVHCASSFQVQRVVLQPLYQHLDNDDGYQPEVTRAAASIYATDPLSKEAALGRRVFHDAVDLEIGEAFPCSGCHPDGRDDGHVWSEVSTASALSPSYFGRLQPEVLNASPLSMASSKGVPRQTPMLAGRVAGVGPYGWTAESKTLMNRVERGMRFHRWKAYWTFDVPFTPEAHEKARALVAFLREGLVPPPESRGDDALAARGKQIFEGSAQCAQCHSTTGDVPTMGAFKLATITVKGFVPEAKVAFKAPTLRFVSGTAPYLHDGSAPTLEDLVEHNDDRMGLTNQLDDTEKKALVAYLRTL